MSKGPADKKSKTKQGNTNSKKRKGTGQETQNKKKARHEDLRYDDCTECDTVFADPNKVTVCTGCRVSVCGPCWEKTTYPDLCHKCDAGNNSILWIGRDAVDLAPIETGVMANDSVNNAGQFLNKREYGCGGLANTLSVDNRCQRTPQVEPGPQILHCRPIHRVCAALLDPPSSGDRQLVVIDSLR